MDFQVLKNSIKSTPAFILDEPEIVQNLTILDTLRQQSGCKILYSIKALPFSAVLEMAMPFVDGFSVSSLFEARLVNTLTAGGGTIHLTSPGLKPDEFDELSALCSHISFNSLSQYERYSDAGNRQFSAGLRVNPKLSFVSDDRYDPCRLQSKLGVDIDALWQSSYLDQIQGLHFHNIFSSADFTPLVKTIEKLRSYFGKELAKLDWLNLGGGYLFNQIDNHQPFVELARRLKNDFELEVYIEPGKAVVGNAGHLVTSVLDSFVSDGKTIVILDTSINHHPEVFEYQRPPELHEHAHGGQHSVILAGSTCLAGDVFGEYLLDSPPSVGDKLVFKNLGAYSLIKANRFNGYNLPDIDVYRGKEIIKTKHYTYKDYRRQWLAD
jgi:carboxynorspermidine decarboxylase